MIDSSLGSGEGSNGLKNWHRASNPNDERKHGVNNEGRTPNVLLEIDHDTHSRHYSEDDEGQSDSEGSDEEDSEHHEQVHRRGGTTSRPLKPLRKIPATKRMTNDYNPWAK